MQNKAVNYYKQGYSCSESVVKAAMEEGLCDEGLVSVATAFSGGMSSGCLCGAIAGSQLVIGHNFGRQNKKGNQENARQMSKQFIDEFKKARKTTCCRALTAGLAFGSVERKQNCTMLVQECAGILENLIGEKVC